MGAAQRRNGIRYIYDTYCDIVQQLTLLQGLQDLHVGLGWFRDLESILERRILGEAYDRRRCKNHTKRLWPPGDEYRGVWTLPPWHTD